MPPYDSSNNKQTIHLQGFRNVIGNQTQKPPPLFLIRKTPQNKQTPFCVSISNKKFYAHPPSSHPQLMMNLNTVIGH